MAATATGADSASPQALPPRHPAFVRITHWLAAIASFALLLTGLEIVVSHPRFYWGETGNVNTVPLFIIPIPASRATVPTGYPTVLPDQNGWSRSLHFQAAWAVVFTGFFYVLYGGAARHFRRNLIPEPGSLNARAIAEHIRRPGAGTGRTYNPLQRLAYLAVIFFLFPLAIWTGLAMSPAVVSALPAVVTTLGGQQTARTIHFFVTIALTAFVAVHLIEIARAGFTRLTRAMITSRSATHKEVA